MSPGLRSSQIPKSGKASLIDLWPLDQTGWLAEREPEFQLWVRQNARWIDVRAGQTLFHAGDEPDGMYGIGKGAVDVEYIGDGMQDFMIFRLHPGAWVGHGTLVPEMPRPFNLNIPIGSRLLKIPYPALRALLTARPHVWPDFYALCIAQILGLLSILSEIQSLPQEVRLARLLLRLSVVNSHIEAGQNDLAALLGISKSSVRRALAKLTELGAIKPNYAKVIVCDEDLLNTIARS